ncbi:CBS domain-containing protein [uncultured Serinicoccus sp.]|uniref:CBS domain-containing protein n=1 Tax=uncultured Serinicoccus sp. TaxID=735514 RepID=UPI002637395D|nr:CBS domain-containing protein [uncultured Serinicoccus sp.]
MTTARDIMTPQAYTVQESASLVEAATLMREHGVGALPVVSTDGVLVGIVTDRDIVVHGVAALPDMGAVSVTSITSGIVSTVQPDEEVERVVDVMGDQQIKRLVVVEGHEILGVISESDLARHVDEDKVVDFVQRVYGRG